MPNSAPSKNDSKIIAEHQFAIGACQFKIAATSSGLYSVYVDFPPAHSIKNCSVSDWQTRLESTPRTLPSSNVAGKSARAEHSSKTLKACEDQLRAYFSGELKQFNLPLDYQDCPPFYRKVYEQLMQIKFAQTISYQALAENSGQARAYRAVGSAMARNRLPFIVPCHRVLKTNGEAGDYYYGTALKRYLLAFEQHIADPKLNKENLP